MEGIPNTAWGNLGLTILFVFLIVSFMGVWAKYFKSYDKNRSEFVKQVMDQNKERESKYLSIIDEQGKTLSDIANILKEFRQDVREKFESIEERIKNE